MTPAALSAGKLSMRTLTRVTPAMRALVRTLALNAVESSIQKGLRGISQSTTRVQVNWTNQALRGLMLAAITHKCSMTTRTQFNQVLMLPSASAEVPRNREDLLVARWA